MYISTTTTDDDRPQYSTPGEILKEEFLGPLGISSYRLAKTIHVPQSAISAIVKGKRRISAPMSVRLGRALGTSPEFWVNLQTDYDLLTLDTSRIEDIPSLVGAKQEEIN